MPSRHRIPKRKIHKLEATAYGLLTVGAFTALALGPVFRDHSDTAEESTGQRTSLPHTRDSAAPVFASGSTPVPTASATPTGTTHHTSTTSTRTTRPEPLSKEQTKAIKKAAKKAGLTDAETKALVATLPKAKNTKNTTPTPSSPTPTQSPSSSPTEDEKSAGFTLGDAVDLVTGDKIKLPSVLNPFSVFLGDAAIPGTAPAFTVTPVPIDLVRTTATATVADELNVTALVTTPEDEAADETSRVTVVTVDTSGPVPVISKPVRATSDTDDVSEAAALSVTSAVTIADPDVTLPPIPETPQAPSEGMTEPPQPDTSTD